MNTTISLNVTDISKSFHVEQWYAKCDLQTPGGSPKLFQDLWGQIYFNNNTKTLFAFSAVYTFARWCKTAGALAQIKA